MTDAAFLAHYYPSLGDPFELDLPTFEGFIDRIAELEEMRSGQVDHASRVARMKRRREEDDCD